MLSRNELREYASLRGLSVRDIEAYCTLNAGYISLIFNGERPLNEENHRNIVNAINAAYAAKQNGTFKRQPLDKNKNAVKEPENSETVTEPEKPAVKAGTDMPKQPYKARKGNAPK